MNNLYIDKIRRINTIIYINLIIILAIVPLFLRIIDSKYILIAIGIEVLLTTIYISIIFRKIKLININENKVSKKNIIGLYTSIVGVIIMCFTEGYVYKGTGKINFFIIIIVVFTLIPMINFDDKYKKMNKSYKTKKF